MAYVESCSRFKLRTRPFATEAELDEWLESKRTAHTVQHSNPKIQRMMQNEQIMRAYWCPGCDQCERLEVSEEDLEAHDWYWRARHNTGQLTQPE